MEFSKPLDHVSDDNGNVDCDEKVLSEEEEDDNCDHEESNSERPVENYYLGNYKKETNKPK